eukprot:c34148_g1_i1 orf=2-1051(+)
MAMAMAMEGLSLPSPPPLPMPRTVSCLPHNRIFCSSLPSTAHAIAHSFRKPSPNHFGFYPQHPACLSFSCFPVARIPSLRVVAKVAALSERTSLRPSCAEAARTLTDVCTEGTLCTLTEEGWPLGTAVRFTVDLEGNPIFRLNSWAIHTYHLKEESRCSLHVQMEQPGHRKPQCTLQGIVMKVVDLKVQQKIQAAWEGRFTELPLEEEWFYVMNVDQVLQASDMGEKGMWVSGVEYKQAAPDPLREYAVTIVEDMNRKYWEDIRRFCNAYSSLDLQVEEAHMTWVDRHGFDLRVLTSSQEILEIRIPFSREVTDERDARSTLTMMAQIAWEYERNYTPLEVQMIGNQGT